MTYAKPLMTHLEIQKHVDGAITGWRAVRDEKYKPDDEREIQADLVGRLLANCHIVALQEFRVNLFGAALPMEGVL